jgi:hypothetical protein
MESDKALSDALIKSYIARAKLFYSTIQEKNIDRLFSLLDDCASQVISWNLSRMGISKKAFSIIQKMTINPSLVFCHPKILMKCPETIAYYRNLAALS